VILLISVIPPVVEKTSNALEKTDVFGSTAYNLSMLGSNLPISNEFAKLTVKRPLSVVLSQISKLLNSPPIANLPAPISCKNIALLSSVIVLEQIVLRIVSILCTLGVFTNGEK